MLRGQPSPTTSAVNLRALLDELVRRRGRRDVLGGPSAPTSRSRTFLLASSRRMRISSFGVLLDHVDLVLLDRLGARSSFSMPLREKIFTSTTMPSMPGGHMSEASRTSPAFSPKIARSSFSSGVSCVSPFGVTLPTRMSPGLTLAPMRMMPLSSRSLSAFSRDVRDVARDLLRAELGVARLDLELLDVDRGVVVVLHHPLGDEDRVLEVVAAPRHEGDEHVAAERQLALLGARAVGQHLARARPSGPR